MTIMTDPQRLQCRVDFVQEMMQAAETTGLIKADLLAAVGGLDQYLSDNAAAINTAIPLPARGALSTVQKVRLMKWVITRRYLNGT